MSNVVNLFQDPELRRVFERAERDQGNITVFAEGEEQAIKFEVRREDGAFNLYLLSGEASKIRIGSLVDEDAVQMLLGFHIMLNGFVLADMPDDDEGGSQ